MDRKAGRTGLRIGVSTQPDFKPGGVSRGRGTDGRVTLDCLVEADGRLACAAADDGENTIFVRPALMVATKFRVAAQTADGAPTVGRRITSAIRFVSPR